MAQTKKSKKLEAESKLYAGLHACKAQEIPVDRIAAIVAGMFEHWGFLHGSEQARKSIAAQIAPKAFSAKAGGQ